MDLTTGADRERYAIIDSIEKMANHLANHNLPAPTKIAFEPEAMQRVRMAFGALGALQVHIPTSRGLVVLCSTRTL